MVLNPNQNVGENPGTAGDDDWFKTKEAFLSTTKVMRPTKNLIKIPHSTIHHSASHDERSSKVTTQSQTKHHQSTRSMCGTVFAARQRHLTLLSLLIVPAVRAQWTFSASEVRPHFFYVLSQTGLCWSFFYQLLGYAGEEVIPRCVGVAFTDSVHWVSSRDPNPVRQFIKNSAINWVSPASLGRPCLH